MNLNAADQAAKVPRIFGDDYPILCNTPLEHAMVRLATPTNVQWMDRIVTTGRVEASGELWGQALVDEQLHAALAQGRPPGRPMSGCVRAKIIAASTASRGRSGLSARMSSTFSPCSTLPSTE